MPNTRQLVCLYSCKIWCIVVCKQKDLSLACALAFQIQVNRSEYLKTVFSVKSIGFLKLIADYKKPVDRNAYDLLIFDLVLLQLAEY